MKTRSWFFIVGLFSILVLALSVAVVGAISNVSITIPGTYVDFTDPPVCGDDKAVILTNITVTGTTDDSGGADYFAILYEDAKGNIMDVDITSVSLSTVSFGGGDDIGIGSLSNPVARPFTAVVYDIPYYSPFDENTPAAADWIKANGSQVYSTTFDPSFDPGCAKLPLAANACLTLPDGSVVGDMPFQTQAYYEPGKVSPGVFVNPGTYWVIGEDESGQYYKILLSCQFLWVPVQNMQPSYSPPWSGQPLPTRVVN